MPEDVTLDLSGFDLANKRVREGLRDGIDAATMAVMEAAVNQVQVMKAIDTGALRNSIYADTSKSGSSRQSAVGKAKAAGKKPGESGKSTSVKIAKPSGKITDELEGKVAVCVEHGVYVHEGTAHMAPRPFLFAAVEEVKPKIADALGKFVKDALDGK